MKTATPKILIAVASKNGSTWEIGKRIGEIIAEHKLRAIVMETDGYYTVDDFDAVVLGSAVYSGHWLVSARQFVDRFEKQLASKPVWLFSSGPIGDPPHPRGDKAVDISGILQRTKAREHKLFAGKLDRDRLSFAQRAVVLAVRAPFGDFRNWPEIEAWATEISRQLRKELL